MALTHLFSALGIAGVVLGAGGLILSSVDPDRAVTAALLEGAALLCLLACGAGHWTRITTFSRARSTRLGANSILAMLLLAGILSLINVLTIRHGGRWDVSETRHFSLAPQTLRALGALEHDVRVTVFGHEGAAGFQAYRDLLESYGHATTKLSVTYVDPDTEPAMARDYEISTTNTAVFERDGRTVRVSAPTEAQLTSALLRVTNDRVTRLVALEGHGERRVTDREREGFSTARTRLEAQGYRIAHGSLRDAPRLLTEADVLILAGPRESPAAEELRRITQFVDNGGRLLLLLDPRAAPGMAEWVAQWGIILGPGIVVDPDDRVARGSPTALLVRRFTRHPITREFTAPLLLPVLQPVSFDPTSAAGFTFTPLAQSSDQSWAETNFDPTITPTYDAGLDGKGPFDLAGALARKADAPASTSTPSMVVIGNSAFAGNTYLMVPGNTDLLLNAVAWLADEDTLLSITPKASAFAPFIPNPAHEHLLFAVQVFSVPFLVLALGVTVWRRRRHL